MSIGPRNYDLNFAAANELEAQAARLKEILERIAAHLAATETSRDSELNDLVEAEHVRRAAEFVLGRASVETPSQMDSNHSIFISFSHQDQEFVSELTAKLDEASVSYFKSDRDIRPATDWGESLWGAIRNCTLVLSIITPRFLASRWLHLEGGAACASKKEVLPVLRYVDPSDIPVPFDRFQSMVVETGKQLDELIAKLREKCSE